MADEEETPTAYCHTTLRDRPKLMWTFWEFSLPGVNMPGVVAGTVVIIAVALLGVGVDIVTGVDFLMYLLLFVGVTLGIGTYAFWGRPLADRMRMTEYLTVWGDWIGQPKNLHGLGRDVEPEKLRWQVILWHPTDVGWLAAYDETLDWLLRQRG